MGGSGAAPAYSWEVQERLRIPIGVLGRRQFTAGGFRGGASLQTGGSGPAPAYRRGGSVTAPYTDGVKVMHGFGLNMRIQGCC
jgi:hypothetical protein